jgi:hypothetical protein
MDDRHGQRDGVPPRRSPDGRWWWDGREWQPIGGRPASGGRVLALLRGVPGFRSGVAWKAIAACVFYASCLLGVLAGAVSLHWSTVGFFASTLAVGLFGVLLRQYLRLLPVNVALVTGLVVALSTCAVSLANAPAPASSSQRPSGSGPVAAQPASPTAEPTATSPPTSAPTPTPAATEAPTPTSTPPAATAAPAPVATRAPAPPPTVRPPPTAAPPPPPACRAAAPSNPWGYDFCPGSVITNVPSSACSYFNCIKSFWNQTNGYLEECSDGTYSHSGGRSGACSSHGGEWRAVESH